MRSLRAYLFLLVVWLAAAVASSAQEVKSPGPWPLQDLLAAPATFPVPAEWERPGVQATFLAGPKYQGKPTRIFAYWGVPEHKTGEKVPAMVLIHGGGGTAFPEWVKMWNERGYAAISMDTCGALPGGEHGKRPRHEWSGPKGWGGFDQVAEPLTDQWAYHAVSAAVLAHSFLRSQPGVDAERIGVTGISWGGYLTCIVAGVDHRFRFAAPVYGCGFLMDNSTWLPQFARLSEQGREVWRTKWEPSNYLPHARMPMLWVTGTNDFAFPLDSLQKSYRSTKGERMLAVRLRMPHGQGQGAAPKEILAMAEHLLKGGPALPKLGAPRAENGTLRVSLSAAQSPAKAELLYTTATGNWKERTWQAQAVEVTPGATELQAPLPPDATVAFINVYDANDVAVSSEHVELHPTSTNAQ